MKQLVLAALLYAGPIFAAEGMWLPEQLPELEKELKELGLEIEVKSLSKLADHPMSAVIDLGGCTASFVSGDGLVVTNYHCAQGSLQYNSTEEQKLLTTGFLARGLAEELQATPGSRVSVTVETRDVTRKVTAGLERIVDGAERFDKIQTRQKELVAECEKDAGHRCRVRAFHGGLRYLLYKQLELRDVRLVYAPPGSIGQFGGETDNWMWPRHTGDFAFLRPYVGPDGKAADYATDNVPYRPRHWLKIAPGGIRENDLVLVIGYPGRTNRYRLASEVRNAFEFYYPTRKHMLDQTLDVVNAIAEEQPDVEIKYASEVAELSNATKNYQGMIDGYAASGMVERRQQLEQELQRWIIGDEQMKRKHESTLRDLQALVLREQATRERDLVLSMLDRVSMLDTARDLYRLSREKEKPDAERRPGYQERDMTLLRQRMERLERRYHPEVDRAVLRLRLESYLSLPADQRIGELDAFLGLDDPADLDIRLDRMYTETRLGQADFRLGLLDVGRKTIEDSQDPFLRLAVALYDGDIEREKQEDALRGEFQMLRARFMEAEIDFLGSRGRPVYPDANSSLRVTYGTVLGYEPRDGVRFTPFTRLEGIVEKYTGRDPFDSPARQLELIEAGATGRYELDTLGSVPVNFLSTVDTTGGNSGSPTLNGRGELVGLLFDGTYDSINADWDFNETKTRSIHVDTRYMLWVMEKVDGAERVLRELGL